MADSNGLPPHKAGDKDGEQPTEEAAGRDARQPKDGQPPQKKRDGKRTVAEWTEQTGERRAIVAGAAQMHGWELETRLGRDEFRKGVAAFANKPMGLRAKPEKKEGSK